MGVFFILLAIAYRFSSTIQLRLLDKKFQSKYSILTNRELKIGWEAREIFDRYNTENNLKILR